LDARVCEFHFKSFGMCVFVRVWPFNWNKWRF